MPPLHSATAQRKRSGQWFVAATPNWPLDDLTILREVDGEIGRELLLALYNARLVAETPVPLRAELFKVTSAPVLEISIPVSLTGSSPAPAASSRSGQKIAHVL
jgi:hypothetical protein